MNNIYIKSNLSIILILLIFTGCGDMFNYKFIFKLDDAIWARAEKINNSHAFSIKMSYREFKKISKTFKSQGFAKDNIFRCLDSKSFHLSIENFSYTKGLKPMAYKKSRLEYGIPMIVYIPEKETLYLAIANSYGAWAKITNDH